jgi:flagellar hook-associated protein 3 FlgL
MIGRITPQMTTAQILNNISTLQDQMNTTEEQLSTGKSINQPSDNPYGASLAVQINTDMAGLTNYSNQVSDGTAWASAATASLQSIQNMVQRVQTLVVQASNGTESASDLSATNQEVTQLTQAIKQEANSQYNGQYIFSGTATGTAPYSTAVATVPPATAAADAFQGNTGAVTRQIGPNSQLAVNANLNSLLGNGSATVPGGDGGLLDTLNKISADLTSGTAGVADLSTKELTNLSTNLTTLEGVQAGVGATSNRLTLASTRIQSLQTSDAAALSNDEDANPAATYTTFSNEQAAFTAALRAGASIVQSSLMDFLSG